MQSYYEITVSRKCTHLFSTAPHSATTLQYAARILEEIQTRFPASEGFDVTITYHSEEINHYSTGTFKRLVDSITPHVGQRFPNCICPGCLAI